MATISPAPPENRAALEYPVEFKREMAATLAHTQAMEAKHRKLPKFIRSEVAVIAGLRGDAELKLDRMTHLATQLGKKIAPFAACKAQCGACCHIGVQMTGIEAQRLGEAIGRAPAVRPAQTPRDLAALNERDAVDQWFGKPCPFVDGQACTIYADRPIACRLHFNLGSSPFFCGVNITPSHSFVANVNLSAFWNGMTAMFWQTGIADIRQWFPKSRE